MVRAEPRPQRHLGAFRAQKMRQDAEDIVRSEGILWVNHTVVPNSLLPEPIWTKVASTALVDAPADVCSLCAPMLM